MAAYKIFFKRSVIKDLDPISKKDLQRIIGRIQLLKKIIGRRVVKNSPAK
ncbi:unnamed protein product, partial [marine sediment metagenome]